MRLVDGQDQLEWLMMKESAEFVIYQKTNSILSLNVLNCNREPALKRSEEKLMVGFK